MHGPESQPSTTKLYHQLSIKVELHDNNQQ